MKGKKYNMVKVLIYQGRPTSGGSKKSLMNLIKLLKEDICFKIIIGSKGWFYDQLEKDGIDYYLNLEHNKIQKNKGIKNNTIRKLISTLYIFLFGIKSMLINYKYIKREKIDYVILNESRDLYFIGIPAILNKCKIVSFVRGEPKFYDYPRFILSYYIISLSDNLIKHFPGFLKKKSKVIPNYIKFEDLETSSKCKSEVVNVAFIGSIVPIKGLENLVEIVNLLDQENYIINIYGDIPTDDYKWYKDKIQKLIDKYNLRKYFSFNGWKENIVPHINETDIVVLTSKSEGLPRAILEAMSLSKPVIAFNVGGVSSLIKDNYNGFLIEYGNNKDFALKLSKLIEDSNLREQFGRNSFKVVKESFSDKVVKKKLLEIFK